MINKHTWYRCPRTPDQQFVCQEICEANCRRRDKKPQRCMVYLEFKEDDKTEQ